MIVRQYFRTRALYRVAVLLLACIGLAASVSRAQPAVQLNGGIGLVADLKVAGDRLVLEIENPGDFAGPIVVTIALDTEAEINDLGQASIEIQPRQSVLFLLSNAVRNRTVEASYILTIRDVTKPALTKPVLTKPGGRLLLYRHARLRQTNSPLPTASLTLVPITGRRASTARAGALAAGTTTTESPAPTPRYDNFTPPPDIQLQARLLAGAGDPPVAVLALDLYAERPRPKIDVEIRLGDYQTKRTINIDRQTSLSFNLPAGFEKGETEPVVRYLLRDRDRRTILEGELALASLIGPEGVVVTDLQMDKPSYQPGEQATITLLLEGRPLAGVTVELSLRDQKGQVFQSEQRQMLPESFEPAPAFTLNIPAGISDSITIEYRVLDLRNGRLYDAGQREILIRVEK